MTITAAEALQLCRDALKSGNEQTIKEALYATKEHEVAQIVSEVVLDSKFRVYWRSVGNKLSRMDVGTEDHEEGILSVKEHLVASGEGFNGAVLAVVGGNNA